MNTVTRQDLLAITEGAKSKIIERLVTKYDVQAAADNARDRIISTMQALHLENQAAIRMQNAQRDQNGRRIAALESQMLSLQSDIRTLQQTLTKENEKKTGFGSSFRL